MHALKLKRIGRKSVSAILILAVVIALTAGAFVFSHTAARAADTDDIEEFETTSLGLSNLDFGSTSGSYPASPSSWTGNYADGGNANIVKGVVDLTPGNYFGEQTGNKKYMLDQYPEYKDERSIPKTIFGADTERGGDAKALLINTAPGAQTVYSYTSSDMTFAPNSFYRVSAWVKTGNFAPDTGATIKLSGLGQDCSFGNINTVRDLYAEDSDVPTLTKENNYGWVQYKFYVRTSASYSKTVKLVLGLGDAVPDDIDEAPEVMPRAAKGYVFFDTVAAERISAHDFANETEYFTPTSGKDNVYYNYNKTVMLLDLYDADMLTDDGGKDIGTFSSGINGWTLSVPYDETAEDIGFAGTAKATDYNSETRIVDFDSPDNSYGFTQNPWAPFGRAEYIDINNPVFAGTNGNIMTISTYNGRKFDSAAYGISSPVKKIERFGYYRFSVWVKGDSVDGGSGISILVKGKSSAASESSPYKLLTSYTGLSGDASDKAHYGWKEQVVYIKGSMLFDYDVKFELWLGSPSSMSKGIAMFDNATFTELVYSEYSARSSADSGNSFTIDDTASDTGIGNGSFKTVGDYDEVKFPLPVAEWKYLTAADAGTVGFSSKEVNTDNVKYGILPTDSATFNKISSSGAIPGVTNPESMYGRLDSVLLLSSTTPTAFCVQSPSITLTSGTAYKLTVDMAVNGVTDGNGAALVLKTGGDVISTIENISTTYGAFKTYTFYLAAPPADKTVNLELWLGLGDRIDNSHKLSNGNVYVREVALNTWSDDSDAGTTVAGEFAEKLAEYKAAVKSAASLDTLDFGIFSFSTLTFDYYDAYSYLSQGGLGSLYLWNAPSGTASVVGMFNADADKGLMYEGFDKKDLSGNMLYIFNTQKTYTAVKTGSGLTLEANKYYRIDISVKVRMSDEARLDDNVYGAVIKLTGPNVAFENIKDTTTLVAQNNESSRDYETFKTYSFYVSTGAEGGDLGLEISLGGSEKEQYTEGKLIVGGLSMLEIDSQDYDEAQSKSDENIIATELSAKSEEDDGNDSEAVSSEIQWWVIPTVIFSAALIAIIIIIIVVRLRDRIKKNKKVTYSSEYDRNEAEQQRERLRLAFEEDDALPEEEDNASDEYIPVDYAEETADGESEQPAPEETEAPATKPVKKQSPAPQPEDLDD